MKFGQRLTVSMGFGIVFSLGMSALAGRFLTGRAFAGEEAASGTIALSAPIRPGLWWART